MKKRGWAPKQGDTFWSVIFDDTSRKNYGLETRVISCPVEEEDFEKKEFSIFKTRKQAKSVKKQMDKAWKKAIRSIYKC